ncbi:PilW family protein [Desulfobacterota bacterium AH_259_B03_O07]|nr:PilW family protein [Desulfobacterota bacterium AH_259_B03_O07]
MNTKGFTVLELMVSVAIFSLMITGMAAALFQQQRQFNLTQDAVDMDQTGRAVLDYIATEIRNAGARQGKTFSLDFENGGSGVLPEPCEDNTLDSGTVTTPPDCLEVYTWDITKGQKGNDLPSVPADVIVFSPGPPLVLTLPDTWFLDDTGNPRTPPLIETEDIIGVRSRLNLCNPDPAVNADKCITDPELCTECAAILRVDINDQNQAVIDSASDIIEQNLQDADFTDLNNFISNFFIPKLARTASELTIADSKTFRIDINQRELEMSQSFDANGEPTNFQPIAGGFDAPGIVDMQIVFNLQAPDGVITKVGVPSDTANRMFADFDELEAAANPALGSIQDIRSVEIYILVRSNTRPRKIFGGFFKQEIPNIGDVAQRTVLDASTEPVEGFVYRVLSTTVYVRNLAREEFG